MEIKMNEMQLPEKISFNYEELKQELTEKVSMYETMVYTDDQIKEAKADKANLNKLKKALNDERIRREKEYMKPFNDFKEKVNEIIGIIDKPIAVIDRQVKEYEEKQRQEKENKILVMINEAIGEDSAIDWLNNKAIFNAKWLNATVSMKSIKEEIDARLEQIRMDVKIISDLPEFSFEAMESYKLSLDVRTALNEANRLSEIAKRKAEHERLAAEAKQQQESITPVTNMESPSVAEVSEEDSEPCENFIPDFEKKLEKNWVVMKINVTSGNEKALLKFLTDNNIEFVIL